MMTRSRLVRNLWLWSGLLVGFALGALMLEDSVVSRLSPFDPTTGRERGCYTTAETWLGLLHPSDLVRLFEMILGGILFFVTPAVALMVVRSRARGARTPRGAEQR
jgi:hypothetical protein